MREKDPQESAGADEDALLMQRVGRGDRGAFARIYDRNASSVVNFAYRFVQNRARAEELSQEIFLKLFRSASAYTPTARFKTFLFRIAANHCLNERRRGEYQADHVSEEAAGAAVIGEVGPDQVLEGRRLEAALAQALSELTERERAAFAMCRFEGLAYREIAQALDCSEPAIKSLIHRATVAVAKRLTPVVGDNPLGATRKAKEATP